MRIILAILLAALGMELYCATHTESLQNTKIRVSSKDSHVSSALVRYVEKCAHEVDSQLKCDLPYKRNVIICQEDCAKGKVRELEYRFKENVDMLCITSGIMRVLLLRRSRDIFGDIAKGPAVDFIAAAMAYSFIMKRRMEEAFADYDYQAAILQSESGFTPQAEDLICHPMSSEMPWLHRLYAMHASLLLGCFRKLNANVPLLMLEAASKGMDIQEIVDDAVCKQLPEGISLQKWYENISRQIIMHDRNSTIMAGIDEKIAELETVSVVEGGALVAKLKQVKIDANKQSIEQLRGDKMLLYKKQHEFLRLRNDAPVLLRPAIERYAKAMGYLASNDVRAFKRELLTARREYDYASKRQERIYNELREFEKEHTSPMRRYGVELEIIRHFHSLEDQLQSKR